MAVILLHDNEVDLEAPQDFGHPAAQTLHLDDVPSIKRDGRFSLRRGRPDAGGQIP
ncbi:hypothetical protein NPA31_005210 [Aurantimonas sp. MSK8Z-1]|uniref:hypothetical protein n=1 Tax=Mangrovibrevibacter kandeliae TaxID=2968473 RepID=UPI002117ACF6|nr:hypothetical protein [Aurantimonas sp. MSK8Z-1]MCW4114360.1 hypothetical protein [Aurantimonas sp. MSK8Z-1]